MAQEKGQADLLSALIKGIAGTEELRDIVRLHAFEFADDANSALRQGGILLAVGVIANDDEGQGYRILVGLPRGTEITGSLRSAFGGHVGEIV